MQLGNIAVSARKVCEVIDHIDDFRDKMIGVHGVFYYGGGPTGWVPALLHKDGGFDGAFVPYIHETPRSTALKIAEPDLLPRIGQCEMSACGDMAYQFDCIALGRVERDHDSGFGGLIRDLNLFVLKDLHEIGCDTYVSVYLFPQERLPELPVPKPGPYCGIPDFKIYPLRGV